MLSNYRLRKKFCHCSLKDLSLLVSELWYDGNRNTIIYLVHSIPHDFDATWRSKQQNKPLEMNPYISAIGLLSTSPALPVVRSQKPLPASWLHGGLWSRSLEVLEAFRESGTQAKHMPFGSGARVRNEQV